MFKYCINNKFQITCLNFKVLLNIKTNALIRSKQKSAVCAPFHLTNPKETGNKRLTEKPWEEICEKIQFLNVWANTNTFVYNTYVCSVCMYIFNIKYYG